MFITVTKSKLGLYIVQWYGHLLALPYTYMQLLVLTFLLKHQCRVDCPFNLILSFNQWQKRLIETTASQNTWAICYIEIFLVTTMLLGNGNVLLISVRTHRSPLYVQCVTNKSIPEWYIPLYVWCTYTCVRCCSSQFYSVLLGAQAYNLPTTQERSDSLSIEFSKE